MGSSYAKYREPVEILPNPVHTFEPKVCTKGYVGDQRLSRLVEKSRDALAKISKIGTLLRLPDTFSDVNCLIDYFDDAKSVLDHIKAVKEHMEQYVHNNNVKRDLINISVEIEALSQPFQYMEGGRINRDSMLGEAHAAIATCRGTLIKFNNFIDNHKGNELAKYSMDDADNMKNTAFITGSSLLLGFATPYMTILKFLLDNDQGYEEEMNEAKGRLISLLDRYQEKCVEERMSLIYGYSVRVGRGNLSFMETFAECDSDSAQEYLYISEHNDGKAEMGYTGTDHWEGWRLTRTIGGYTFSAYEGRVKELYRDKFATIKEYINSV